MSTLFGTKIKDTYDGLLKVSDNVGITSTKKIITDGLGNDSSVYISSEDFQIATFFYVDINSGTPASSRIGLGTSSPTTTLHIVGDLRLTARFYDGSNSAGTSGRVLMSTGAATSWSNTFTTAMTFDSGVILNAGIKDYTGSTGTSNQILSSTGSDVEWVSLSEISGVDGTGVANKLAYWLDTETLTYDNLLHWDSSNNRLGVGTATPQTRLEVNGNFRVSSGNEKYLDIDDGGYVYKIGDIDAGEGGSYLKIDSNNSESNLYNSTLGIPTYIFHQGNTITKFGFSTTDTFVVRTNDVERFSVNNSGVALAGGSRVTTILDEDDMASDSNTALATQQSIKAFVESEIAAVPSGLNFQGNWNADTNSPTLASGTGTVGHFYSVSTPGSTVLNGENDWKIGDWAVFVEAGGTDKWMKIDNTSVLSGVGSANKIAYWSNDSTLTYDDGLFYDATDDKLTITGTGNSSGLEIGGSNSRIYFSGYRAIEGQTNGVHLYLGETFTTVAIPSDTNFTVGTGTATFGGNVTLTDGVLTVNDGNNYVKISEGSNSIGQIELKDSNPVFVQGWGSDYRVAIGTYDNVALTINSAKNATFAGDVTVGHNLKMPTDGEVDWNGGDVKLVGTADNIKLQGGSLSITADGSNAATFTESGSGDFTIATIDDLRLDSGGNDIVLRGASSAEFGRLTNDSQNFIIRNITGDKDIIFRGKDDTTVIDALTLDMSDSGTAIFNHHISIPDYITHYQDASTRFGFSGSGTYVINTSGTTALTIDNSQNATFAGDVNINEESLYLFNSSNNYWRVQNNSSGKLVFKQATTQRGIWSSGELELANNLLVPNGQIGIGTTSPSSLLHLSNTNGGAIYIEDSDSTNTYNITSISNGGGNLSFDTRNSTGGFVSTDYQMVKDSSGANYQRWFTQGNERMRIDSSGNVGIGTTSPNNKLDVKGDIGIVRSGTTNTSTISMEGNFIFNASSGYNYKFKHNGSDLVMFKQTGEVGIGTTSPNDKLEVADSSAPNIRMYRSGTGQVWQHTIDSSGRYMLREAASSGGTLYTRFQVDDTGEVALPSYGSGTFTGTATQRLAVDSSGNIIEIAIGSGAVDGSGTSNFVTKWSDADTLTNSLIYDDGTNVYVNNGSTDYFGSSTIIQLISGASNKYVGIRSNTLYLYGYGNGSDSRLIFGDGSANFGLFSSDTDFNIYNYGTSSDAVTILRSNSNVGIGTTSPGAKLHIVQTSYPAFKAERNGGTTATQGYTQIGHTEIGYSGGTGADSYIISQHGFGFVVNESSKLLVLTDSEKVGIGTDDPYYKLDTRFSNTDTSFSGGSSGNWGSNGIRIENTSSTTNTMSVIHLRNSDADIHIAGIRQGTDDSDLGFFFESSEKVRFTKDGNVGIGTTSPSEKLSISGGNIAVANGSSIMIGGSIGDTKIGKLYNVSGVLSLDGDGTRNIRLGSTTNGEVVRIDNTNGRVGIGTTSPGAKLEVKSSGGDEFFANFIPSTGSGYAKFYQSSNNHPSLYMASSTGTASIVLNSSGVSYLTSGNLIIGGSADSGELLQVEGTSAFSGNATFAGQITLNGTDGHINLDGNNAIVFDNTNNNNAYYIRNGGTNAATMQWGTGTPGGNIKMVLDGSGNLGIGTTSPDSKLTVSGNTEVQNSQLKVRDTSTNHQLTLQSNVASNARIMAHKTNLNSDQNLDIKATQIDLYSGSISGSTNVSTLLLDSSNNATFAGNVNLADNKKLNFGAIPDFEIYHNSTTNVNYISSLLDRQLSINANIIQLTNQANSTTYLRLESTGATFAGSVTANSLTVDDITIDGSTISDSSALTISSGDDITIDADSDINLDANGADIRFKDNGTAFVEFNSSTGTTFAGSVDATNYKINGAQGSDGQVLTSTGSGVAWETPSGGGSSFNGGTITNNLTISNASPALNLTDTDNSSNIAISSVGGALIVNPTSDQVYQIGGSEKMRLTTTGLGIGTTSPTYKLDVETSDEVVASFISTDNKAVIQIADDDTTGYVSAENSRISIGPQQGLHANNINIKTDSYNVGIGTTSPGQKLEVAGRIRVTTDPTIEFYEASNKRGGIQWDITNDYTNIFAVGGDIRFDIGGEKMRINSSGNVGIGTTSPSNKLEVKGVIGIERTANTDISTISMEGNFIFNANSGYNYKFQHNGSDLVMFKQTGEVGIGTTSPGAILEISDATNDNLRIGTRGGNINIFSLNDAGATAPLRLEASQFDFINGNATFAGKIIAEKGVNYTGGTIAQATTVLHTNNVIYSRGGSAGMFLQNADGSEGMFIANDHVKIETNSSERMRITSDGKIGINTTSPSYPVHVYSGGSERFAISGDVFVRGATDLKITGTSRRISFDSGTGTIRTSTSNNLILQTNSTTAFTLDTSQNATFAGSVHLDNDSAQLQLGDDNDMQIYSNGANGVIDNNTGDLIIRCDSDDIKILAEDDVVIRDNDDSTEMAKFINGGAVELYHNGNKKIETTSGGVDVSGGLYVDTGIYHNGDTNNYIYFSTDTQRFYTSGSERMRIDSSGRVGIGTTSLTEAFVVSGNIELKLNEGMIGMNVGDTWGDSDEYCHYGLAKPNGAEAMMLASYFGLKFGTNGSERLEIAQNGKINCGAATRSNTTSSFANMYMDSTSGEIKRSTSSRRYKTNIVDYTKGLDEVLQLQPKTYNDINGDSKQFAGLIAEDVHDLGLNEYVYYNENNEPDALGYSHMIALLTNAIKELKQENDDLKARVSALEK